MKTVLLFLTLLTINATAKAATYGPLHDTGVSEEYLVRLGTAAEADLLHRLDEPKNGKYFEGIISRLALIGDLKKPNPGVTSRLRKFVDRQTECQNEVPEAKVFAVIAALKTIGQRGGNDDLNYLNRWISSNDLTDRVNCHFRGSTVKKTRYHFREAAVLGIGLSGTKGAHDRLLTIRRNLPKVEYPGNFVGAVDNALFDNERIQKGGIEAVYGDDISRIKQKQGEGRK